MFQTPQVFYINISLEIWERSVVASWGWADHNLSLLWLPAATSSLALFCFCCHRTAPTAWTAPSAVTAATPTGATPPRATAAASQDGQVQDTPWGGTNRVSPTVGLGFVGKGRVCEVGKGKPPILWLLCSSYDSRVGELCPVWDLQKTGNGKGNVKACAPPVYNSLKKWWSTVNTQRCCGSFGVKRHVQELRKLHSGSQEEGEPLS